MKQLITIGIPGLALAALISYGFALAGEPQAVWIWRDVIGVNL